jgi:hypothetical protein
MLNSSTMQRPLDRRTPDSLSPRRLAARVRLSLTLSLALSLALVLGCGPETVSDDKAEALEQILRAYLPVMSEGYATGNLEPLREYAVEKELSRMFKRISDLAAEGKTVEPELKSLTVEDIYLWGGGANAVVSTFEVWDLRVYASPSHALLAEETDQPNRVKYHIKRRAGRWEILNRELVQTIQQ